MEATTNLEDVKNKLELVNDPASNAVCELLECPVCFKSMHPPIHQCSNGHTICSGCKPKVQNKCPTCRGELGNIRCLALEKLATALELQCAFQLKTPYNCPYVFLNSECTTSGDILHLVAHLKDDHKVVIHRGCTFNLNCVHDDPYSVENPTWTCKVYSCFGQYFCFHMEGLQFQTAPVYIAYLRFMGDDNDAKKYNYSLEVEGNERKLMWQGIPRSIRDSHKKVRDNFDGLTIQRSTAFSFFGKDPKKLKLKVTGRIWKK